MIGQVSDELVISQLLPTWVDIVAITLGAITGSIVARRWGADVAGIVIVAIISGLGGGIVRDLLLNRMPVALTNEALIPAALVAAGIGFFFSDLTSRLKTRLDPLILLLDALFLGTYAIIGTEKAMLVNLPAVSCVFVGVLSGVGGGMMRDVLLNDEPQVLRPGAFNAVAAVAGTSLYVVLVRNADLGRWVGVWCLLVIVVLRVLSVAFKWHTPVPRDLITESKAGRYMADRVRLDRILPPETVPPAAITPDDITPDAVTSDAVTPDTVTPHDMVDGQQSGGVGSSSSSGDAGPPRPVAPDAES